MTLLLTYLTGVFVMIVILIISENLNREFITYLITAILWPLVVVGVVMLTVWILMGDIWERVRKKT